MHYSMQYQIWAPFTIEIFVDNQKILLKDCKHFPDGVEKIKEYC